MIRLIDADALMKVLEESDFNDIQMVVREVLLKYGFPYESVVQDEVWNALDELSTNKFAISIVNQLAGEYNNGWVPCSERLPEILQWVLIQKTQGDMDVVRYIGEAECWGNDFYHRIHPRMVIAWQPLPQPYQPEGE